MESFGVWGCKFSLLYYVNLLLNFVEICEVNSRVITRMYLLHTHHSKNFVEICEVESLGCAFNTYCEMCQVPNYAFTVIITVHYHVHS